VKEVHRILRDFARQVCRGGGPHGALDTDWEDVAQEASRTFFDVGLHQYRGTGSERSYLYSVVRMTAIQISRRAWRRRRREEASVVQPVDRSNPNARLDVVKILAALSQECRELIERVFLHGESYGVLATELGLAESSVRSRLSRCVKAARRFTGEDAA
jgi:RNA polymerase sigma factor (sigma-70 family)